ncbi:hypothetical protein [Methylobacterium sp. CM6257]|jgi:hypothetical protein
MVDLRTLFGDARTNIRSADAGPVPAATSREQGRVQLERAAAALPTEGPLSQIVGALDAVLTALRQLDATSPAAWTGTHLDPFCDDPNAELGELVCEPVAYALRVSLFRLGLHAHRLTGSIETMRAIHHKAANMVEDTGDAEYRRDVLDKAWHGIGDEHGTWIA